MHLEALWVSCLRKQMRVLHHDLGNRKFFFQWGEEIRSTSMDCYSLHYQIRMNNGNCIIQCLISHVNIHALVSLRSLVYTAFMQCDTLCQSRAYELGQLQ